MRLFMPIQKTEELSDGTLLVTGIASTEAIDADGEVVKSEAIEKALPDFMRYGTGALREMHQPLAAGTVDKAEVADGVTTVECTVVDPVAIKKVKTGTYKGFSIGGRVLARDKDDKKLVTGIKLVEVSLVDRPANPDAVIELWKAEASEESTVSKDPKAAVQALAELLNKGTITPARVLELAEADLAKAADAEKPGDSAAPPASEAVEKSEAAAETPPADAAQAPAGDPPAADAQQPPAVEAATKAEAPSGDVLRKGMYSLKTMIDALSMLACAAGDAQFESEWRGDSSPVPERLRVCLADACSILCAMTEEETKAMLDRLMPKQAADAGGDLAKGEQPAAAAPAADAAGAAPGPAAASSAEDLAKAELAKRDEQLAKALAAVEDLGAKLAKATERIEALEQQPLPGKALLKAITKGEDVAAETPSAPAVEPVRKVDGSVDEAASLIKSAHARGGIPVRFA